MSPNHPQPTRTMSDTYEINDDNEVIPYTSGRRCNDTRSWRNATDLELQQRDEIVRLESELERKRDELQEQLAAERALANRLAEVIQCVMIEERDLPVTSCRGFIDFDQAILALAAWKEARDGSR